MTHLVRGIRGIGSLAVVFAGTTVRQAVCDISMQGEEEVLGGIMPATWYGRCLLIFMATLGDKSVDGVFCMLV